MKLIHFTSSAVGYGEGTAASDHDEDNQAGVVTLLHNIIIAGDEQTRAWFAQYLKCMQQKVCPQVYYLDFQIFVGMAWQSMAWHSMPHHILIHIAHQYPIIVQHPYGIISDFW